MKLAQDLTAMDFELLGFKATDYSRFREETYVNCVKGRVTVNAKGAYGVDILVDRGTFRHWEISFSGNTPASIIMGVISGCPA